MENEGKGLVKECEEEESLQMFETLIDVLGFSGYEHYEISNFARSGRYALHNTSYWKGVPYLGLGAAAHSYDGKSRRINPSSLSEYMEALQTGHVAYMEEKETVDSLYNEYILTSLRTCWGLDLKNSKTTLGLSACDIAWNKLCLISVQGDS